MQDADGDGYDRDTIDCDDDNPGIHPEAADVCDGIKTAPYEASP